MSHQRTASICSKASLLGTLQTENVDPLVTDLMHTDIGQWENTDPVSNEIIVNSSEHKRQRRYTDKGFEYSIGVFLKKRNKLNIDTKRQIQKIVRLLDQNKLDNAKEAVVVLTEIHDRFVLMDAQYRELVEPGIDCSDEVMLSNDVLSSVAEIRDKVAAALMSRDQEALMEDNDRRTLNVTIQERIQEINVLLKDGKLLEVDVVMENVDALLSEFMSVTANNQRLNPEYNSVERAELTHRVDSSVFIIKKALADQKADLELKNNLDIKSISHVSRQSHRSALS